MIWPDWQLPHCGTFSTSHACWVRLPAATDNGAGAGRLPVDLNRARAAQPHAAPNLVPFMLSTSRNVHSSGMSSVLAPIGRRVHSPLRVVVGDLADQRTVRRPDQHRSDEHRPLLPLVQTQFWRSAARIHRAAPHAARAGVDVDHRRTVVSDRARVRPLRSIALHARVPPHRRRESECVAPPCDRGGTLTITRT
jgi:hypothetical protein